MSAGMTVTLAHAFSIPGFSKKPGFCRPGMRAWFEANGMDYEGFKRHGIAASTLEATGDPFALALVAWARECEGAGNG